MRIVRHAAAWLLASLVFASAAGAVAAETEPSSGKPSPKLVLEFVRNRAAELAASAGMDETLRTQLAELYNKAIGSLEAAAAFREAAQGFERAIRDAPREAERVRAEIDRRTVAGDAPSVDLGRLSLEEIEQRLLEKKGELTALDARLDELKGEIESQEGRPTTIRQPLSDVETQLSELETAPSTKPSVAEAPELGEARNVASQAQIDELRAKALMLRQELASQPMRLALLKAQRDLVALQLGALQREVGELETVASQIRLERTTEAKIAAQVAELSAADKHPLLAEIAGRNTELSQDVERLAREIDDIEREERRASEEARRIDESFNATRKKIEVAGVSQILGQVLQEQRRSLPHTDKARRKARERERKIAETALSQILLEEERSELRDIPAYVERLTASLPAEVKPEVGGELEQLARSRLDLIDQALSVQRRYLQGMGELDIAQRRLEDTVEQFDSFLAERLLWVRSSQPAGLETMRRIPGQLARLASPALWGGVVPPLVNAGALATIGLAILAALVLWLRRSRLLGGLQDAGKTVGNLLRDRLNQTLLAFGYILLLALPVPLILMAVGWTLSGSYDATDFGKRLGEVLMSLAVLLFQLNALREFVAPGSVAAVHFGWREPGLKRLRGDLRWFSPLLVVAAGFTMLTFASATQHWGSGLGRAAFLLVMALLIVFFFRLTRPTGGTMSILFAHQQQGRPFRLRHLWFVLLVGSPLVAAVVSLAGYMYTAGTLMGHILDTVWFALLVVIVHQFVIRWLVLNQRKLRLQAARERRRAEQEARGADAHPEEIEGALARDFEEPQVDLSALDAASRKLTNNALLLVGFIGTWVIWQDTLPALGILDEVTLWSYSKPGVELPVPITLSNLGLAILILVIMILATRQLPAFLEVVLLQRLAVSQGSRYTTVTLTKYMVVAIGVAWIFSTLGGSWSEIQWIFAALGVGIGFGLQEIVANFISGLIILFERPIRVGDVVTVGNTDGVVTRIRIRATTIRNWDQKELLVPNKNFITQELLNWSLSDQTTRILIRVGIAYGSNVQRALQIMEEAARNHPRILAEPPPFVVFEEFGDNALLLSLRCYIDNLDYRLRTVTDLNLAINDAMAAADIEIAFPQRDVHLDTKRPLDVRIHSGSPTP